MINIEKWHLTEFFKDYYGELELQKLEHYLPDDINVFGSVTAFTYIARLSPIGQTWDGNLRYKCTIKFENVCAMCIMKHDIAHNTPLAEWLDNGLLKRPYVTAFKVKNGGFEKWAAAQQPAGWAVPYGAANPDDIISYFVQTLDDIIYEVVTATLRQLKSKLLKKALEKSSQRGENG